MSTLPLNWRISIVRLHYVRYVVFNVCKDCWIGGLGAVHDESHVNVNVSGERPPISAGRWGHIVTHLVRRADV